jgi:hypothetical protein
MNDSHLRENIRHDESDTSSQKVRNDDGGAGKANGNATSQKQSDTNGAAYRHHGELPLAQAALKTFRSPYRNFFRFIQSGTNRYMLAINHRRQPSWVPGPEEPFSRWEQLLR